MGLSMIGGTVLVMALFFFVSHEDMNVREATWKVISGTISIFCGVLVFTIFHQTWHDLVFSSLGKTREDFELQRYANKVYVGFWYIVFVFSCSWKAKIGFGLQRRRQIEGDAIQLAKQKNKLACSILWAHVVGFANNFAWGLDQTSHFMDYRKNWKAAMSLAIHPAYLWLGYLWVLALLRELFIRRCLETEVATEVQEERAAPLLSSETGGEAGLDEDEGEEEEEKENLVDLWNEQLEDGENDLYGLTVSFLLVQAFRFGIGLHLPNEYGEEEGDSLFHHGLRQTLQLYGVGFLMLLCGIMVPLVAARQSLHAARSAIHGRIEALALRMPSRRWQDVARLGIEAFDKTLERLKDVAINVSRMTFSWCFMFASQWWIARCCLLHGLGETKGVVTILLSIFCTLCGLAAIMGMDKICDWLEGLPLHRSTSTLLRSSIRDSVNCNGFLIGFTWEQSMDMSLDMTVLGMFGTGFNATAGKVFLAFVTLAFVYWPWWHIIQPMVNEEGYKLGWVGRRVVAKINRMIHDAEQTADGPEMARRRKAHLDHIFANLDMLRNCHDTHNVTRFKD